ncbi:hypothetical protein [uncultured Psychrobacter sp.]|uniref:hypothetical protein n=1 Tax=uncultured Psychrobacter sp. TaxID=259303 RepID=UPI0030D77063
MATKKEQEQESLAAIEKMIERHKNEAVSQVAGDKVVMLSTHIRELSKLLMEHGDHPLAYSSDDEGNAYSYCRYTAGMMKVDGSFDPMSHHLEVLESTDKKTPSFQVVCVN